MVECSRMDALYWGRGRDTTRMDFSGRRVDIEGSVCFHTTIDIARQSLGSA